MLKTRTVSTVNGSDPLDFTQENNTDPQYIASIIKSFDNAKTRQTIILSYENPWTIQFLRALPDKYHASVTLIANENGASRPYHWSSLRPKADQLFHDHTSAAHRVKKILEKIEQKPVSPRDELDKMWHLFLQRMAYDFWWTLDDPKDKVLAAEYLLRCTQKTAKRKSVFDIKLPLERPYNKFDLIVAILTKLSSDTTLARSFVKFASLDTIFSCSVQDEFGREFLWDTIGRVKVKTSSEFDLPEESMALAYSLKEELRLTVSRGALYNLSVSQVNRAGGMLDSASTGKNPNGPQNQKGSVLDSSAGSESSVLLPPKFD